MGSADKAEQWIRDALARKERIMGFGHRVYKDGDPRAIYLKTLMRRTRRGNRQRGPGADGRHHRSDRHRRRRSCPPNVDWPCARLYHYLGLPIDLFTPLFVVARVVGWCAHVIEQLDNNRLMRPRSLYVGPEPRAWVEVEKRG